MNTYIVVSERYKSKEGGFELTSVEVGADGLEVKGDDGALVFFCVEGGDECPVAAFSSGSWSSVTEKE